jgi:tripartite ATP-independent transporter DctM subunit
MFVALGALIFSGLPVALVLTGISFVFGLLGWWLGLMRLTDFDIIYFRVFGTLTDADDVLWAAVPMLIFMGAVLQQSGIARELLLCLKVLFRRVPGGLAIAVTLIGVVLAPAAGMIGASVATLALLALPTMLEQGYRPSFATGSIAAAGTLGMGLPPGIMLFFLADAMGMQVPFIFLAMLGPGLLLVLLYLGYFVTACWLNPGLAPHRPTDDERHGLTLLVYLLRSLFLPVALVTLMLGSIVVGWATLSESAAVGAAGAVLLSLLHRSLSLRLLHQAIRQTAVMTAMVFFIFVGATAFSLIFRLLGGVEAVTAFLGGLHIGSWGTLTLVLLVIFAMGCFMDWIEIVLISFTIFRPVLDSLDFSGYIERPYVAFGWITVLVALTLQSSFLTPPFGFALFFVKGAAPRGVRMVDVYRGIVPFVVIQVIVIACVAAVPAVATWLPDQVLKLDAPRKSQQAHPPG